MTIYPISAPSTDELLYETEILKEVCKTCETLHLERQYQGKYVYEQVNERFRAMFEVMTAVHHMEISILSGRLDWERALQELAVLLPQFAWLGCKVEKRKHNRQCYYIEFVPIVYKPQGFPFDIQLKASIQQQLFYSTEEAVKALCSQIEQLVVEKKLWLSEEVPVSAAKLSSSKKFQTDAPPISQETTSVENQLLVCREEIKRTAYSKERMRIANEKLELLIEKLEQTIVDCGISYLKQPEEGESASNYLRISLREYAYLKQKAKDLEKLWLCNKDLLKKAEELTVENKSRYKKKETEQLREMIFESDIYLVIEECRAIDTRAVINPSPWFRPPYVKLMQGDYRSLLSKAAYFDLLQGENYFLRKLIYEQESEAV